MIKIKIADIAKTKGIDKAHDLQKALNCSPTTASKLWKGNFTQIGIETIDRLCELLDCEPSDLFGFVSQKPKAEKPTTRRSPQTSKLAGTEGMLTTKQAGDRSGLNPRTIRDNIKSGKLKTTKTTKGHLISESDFEEFCKSREATSPQ